MAFFPYSAVVVVMEHEYFRKFNQTTSRVNILSNPSHVKLHTSLMVCTWDPHEKERERKRHKHTHISISLHHSPRISIIISSIVLWLCKHVYRENYISHSKPLVPHIDFYWIYRHVMITVCFSCMLLTHTHTHITLHFQCDFPFTIAPSCNPLVLNFFMCIGCQCM